MSHGAIIVLMTSVFLALGFMGVAVPFAILAGVLLGTLWTQVSLASIVGQLFEGVNTLALLAIPFFMLAGELLASSNVSQRIVDLAEALVGHIRGGLAQVVTVFSMLFSGISGSSTADVAAISRVLMPSMKEAGYEPARSAALVAAASTIANMIPPSIMAIVYGAIGGVSISALFIGGIIPGVLIGVGLMFYNYFFGSIGTTRKHTSWTQKGIAVQRSFLPLMIPVLILGGILGGYFTPTEAGMAAVIYTVFVVIPLVVRGHIKRLPEDFMRAAVLYSLPLMAVASASAFAWMVAYLQGPQVVAGWIQQVAGHDPAIIMLLLVVALIIVGNFMDAIPAIVIFMPIISGLVKLGGINSVQMGVIAIVTLAFGLITPPYGLSLLLASTFAEVPFSRALWRAIPIYAVFLVVILLMIFIPDITLLLPRHFLPQSVGCFPNPRGAGYICP